MKKSIFTLLGVCILLFGPVSLARAVDWSEYDSGMTSIRVEGYQTQPGYIAFYDENGTVRGYLYAHSNGKLYWASPTYTTLSTEKLGSNGGEVQVAPAQTAN